MSEPINPYAATETTVDFAHDENPLVGEASMVNQLTIVGILQIVLGCLEGMMGVILVFSGFFIIAAMRMPANQGTPPPENFLLGMQLYYWIVGGGVSIFAIMRIGSGIASFWFRGRVWLLISLAGGLLSIMTCYCLPLSVAMCVYGFVVALSSGVRKAYVMGAAGVPPGEIKRRFMTMEYGSTAAIVPSSQPPGE